MIGAIASSIALLVCLFCTEKERLRASSQNGTSSAACATTYEIDMLDAKIEKLAGKVSQLEKDIVELKRQKD